MDNLNATIQYISSQSALFAKEKLSFVGLFGSRARGDARDESDVDILIDYPAPKSFFELARIRLTLEKGLNKNIDLMTIKSLKPRLRANIDHDLITIYGQR